MYLPTFFDDKSPGSGNYVQKNTQYLHINTLNSYVRCSLILRLYTVHKSSKHLYSVFLCTHISLKMAIYSRNIYESTSLFMIFNYVTCICWYKIFCKVGVPFFSLSSHQPVVTLNESVRFTFLITMKYGFSKKYITCTKHKAKRWFGKQF